MSGGTPIKLGGEGMAELERLFGESVAHFEAGRLKEAEAELSEIQRRHPDLPEVLHLMALIELQTGRTEAAAGHLEKAVARQPDSADLHNLLGGALKRAGRLEEAVLAYDKAVSLGPELAEAHYNLGNALKELQRFDDAVPSYRRAVELEPGFADAHYNLGLVLMAAGRPDEAARAYRDAVGVNPEDAEAHMNLGNALEAVDETDAAVDCFRRAIDAKPRHVEAHVNLGAALHDLCRLDEARESFRRALDIDPGYATAHDNLGMTLLLDGQFKEGWAEYTWRTGQDVFLSVDRVLDKPFWDGSDLDGKTLLLFAGQGLGDTIQFFRYLPKVAAKGGDVILQCPAPLMRLLKAAPAAAGIQLVTEIGDAPFDLQAPLHSLPHLFESDMETIPADVPFLAAEDERVGDWRDRIGGNGFRIGIGWQGNPTYKADRNRSIPLRFFEPLAKVPKVRLISLQKVNGLEQLETLPRGMTVETLGDDFDDGEDAFIDTAAVMMILDLIITSDTAIAHLAGAFAKPVWTLLPWVPDWRWFLDRDDSPWYPSMRLFRQPAAGNWDAVFKDLSQALGELAEGNP